jgi:hypothetical protein
MNDDFAGTWEETFVTHFRTYNSAFASSNRGKSRKHNFKICTGVKSMREENSVFVYHSPYAFAIRPVLIITQDKGKAKFTIRLTN